MPGSCEADKSSSSSLISSLRSYRLKTRAKNQSPSLPSTADNSNSSSSSDIVLLTTDSSNSTNSSPNAVRNNYSIKSKPSQLNSSNPGSSSNSVVSTSSAAQSYSPLGYRKYEISHTSQFIFPCIQAKIQQALKQNSPAILDLLLKLTEEEYTRLKEFVLKEPLLAEKWKTHVNEGTSYTALVTREIKVHRHYLVDLRRQISRYLSIPARSKSTNIENSSSASKVQSYAPKPVRTYSRTPKTPSPKALPVSVVFPTVSSNTMNDITINSKQSSTNCIMDEYEVFCEKEKNLRKLLDAFPGADIMEAQDILVKCNWDIDKARQIAAAQPLRCSKKKAAASPDSMSVPSNSEVNYNSLASSTSIDQDSKMTEEIILDSSDEEFNNAIKQINRKRSSTGQIPASKRARKVVSSSESEEDSTGKKSQLPAKSINSYPNVSSVHSVVTNTNNVPSEKSFSSISMKVVPTTLSENELSKQKPSSVNSLPNLPKGLVITQLSSSTLKVVSNSEPEISLDDKKLDNIKMVNKKAEVINVSSDGQTNLSPNSNANKSAQLVRIQMSNNGIGINDKSNAGYSVHNTGSIVTMPTVRKGMTITPVANSSKAHTTKPEGDFESIEERATTKSRILKSKRKKYIDYQDDEDQDYGNEDIYDSEDSDMEENLTSAHSAVLKFFQEATVEELSSIPGCSKKKTEVILNIRPFANWVDLVQKLGNDKNLSTDLLNGAKKVLDMRNAINKLMTKCQQISLDMEDLVEGLKENRENSTDYVAKQPDLLNDKMHLASYQMLGLNWLLLMHNQEVNGILADEMGLGKTVQAIAFLAYLKQISMSGPHLIVVPSSTLDNWKQEFMTWWPSVSVIIYHGSQESRRDLRFEILNDEVEEFDVMITTYTMVTSSAEDRSFFKRLEFQYVVFDEAHMLKNMSSQRYQHLMKIRAPRRLLLTGTPLQNNLVELMSLLIFAMPHMFSGKTEHVKQMFSAVSKTDGNKNSYEKDRIDHAKRIMKPFVLRRLKREVLQDLPAKYDETRLVPMVEDQAEKYKKLVEKFSAEVASNKEDGEQKSSASRSGMMMQLRRAANHPLLLRNLYDDEKLIKMANDITEEPTHTQSDPNLVHEDMSVMSDFELHKLCKQYKSLNSYALADEHILNSGKFKVLDELLPRLIKEDHRVLLFSQFTMVLDIIEEYMHIKEYKYMRLDGSTQVSERQQMIDAFNNDNSISVFLLSTRAGGLGINLTAADTVILHDIDFNPYNDKQAEDRCHRVGQIRDVHVTRLISEHTIEEGILHIAKEKLKLERDIHEQSDSEENDSANVAKLLRDALGLTNTKS